MLNYSQNNRYIHFDFQKYKKNEVYVREIIKQKQQNPLFLNIRLKSCSVNMNVNKQTIKKQEEMIKNDQDEQQQQNEKDQEKVEDIQRILKNDQQLNNVVQSKDNKIFDQNQIILKQQNNLSQLANQQQKNILNQLQISNLNYQPINKYNQNQKNQLNKPQNHDLSFQKKSLEHSLFEPPTLQNIHSALNHPKNKYYLQTSIIINNTHIILKSAPKIHHYSNTFVLPFSEKYGLKYFITRYFISRQKIMNFKQIIKYYAQFNQDLLIPIKSTVVKYCQSYFLLKLFQSQVSKKKIKQSLINQIQKGIMNTFYHEKIKRITIPYLAFETSEQTSKIMIDCIIKCARNNEGPQPSQVIIFTQTTQKYSSLEKYMRIIMDQQIKDK